MYFLVIEFAVCANDSIFSDKEQQKLYLYLYVIPLPVSTPLSNLNSYVVVRTVQGVVL